MNKDKITVYQKPTCSKCRNLLKTLKERGVEHDSVNYYEQPFTAAGLKKILAKLGMKPIELMRTNEKIYKDLRIGQQQKSDEELIKLMVEHPDLIQRPIVIRGDKAVVARPTEKAEEVIF